MSKSKKNKYLDNEEKDLEKAINKIDITKLSTPSTKKQSKFKSAAANFIKKETKMNIRINSFELDEIKKRAEIEGLKYQPFIKSVLHKYITGQLIEKKPATSENAHFE